MHRTKYPRGGFFVGNFLRTVLSISACITVFYCPYRFIPLLTVYLLLLFLVFSLGHTFTDFCAAGSSSETWPIQSPFSTASLVATILCLPRKCVLVALRKTLLQLHGRRSKEAHRMWIWLLAMRVPGLYFCRSEISWGLRVNASRAMECALCGSFVSFSFVDICEPIRVFVCPEIPL